MNVITNKKKPEWIGLIDEMHELIVEKLDNKAKRALRSTCMKMHNRLNQFPCMDYTTPYTCSLEEVELADGQKRYDMIHYANQDIMDPIVPRQSFATVEEMIDCLQKVFKKMDTLNVLTLKVKGFSTPVKLLKNQRKLKVETLNLQVGGDSVVIDRLFTQFDANYLRSFNLFGAAEGERAFGAYEARNLCVYTRISDAELLSIRARSVQMFDASGVTISGLKNFLKKMIKGEGASKFKLFELNEQQLEFFDCRERSKTDVFFISPDNCDNALSFHIIHMPPEPTKLTASVFPKADAVRPNPPTEPSRAVRNFIQSIELDL